MVAGLWLQCLVKLRDGQSLMLVSVVMNTIAHRALERSGILVEEALLRRMSFSGQSEIKINRSDCSHCTRVNQRVAYFESVPAQKQVRSKSTTLK